MDRLSFVFSLLLIVSVTTITFGSVIKAKNPNGEELGAFLKRSHHQSNPDMKTDAQAKLREQNELKDQESEMPKRVDPETLIPRTITVAMLQERLKKLPPDDKAIAIAIENQSGYDWKGFSKYIVAGTEPEFPDVLHNGNSRSAVSYGQRGVAGVLVYYIEPIHSPLAVMYDVEYSSSLRVNVWCVKMYREEKHPDLWTYLEMRDGCRHVANNFSHHGNFDVFGLKYEVSMSTGSHATLEIRISHSN